METGTQCKRELFLSATVAVSIVELYGLTITSVIAWSKECVIFGKRRVKPHQQVFTETVTFNPSITMTKFGNKCPLAAGVINLSCFTTFS